MIIFTHEVENFTSCLLECENLHFECWMVFTVQITSCWIGTSS